MLSDRSDFFSPLPEVCCFKLYMNVLKQETGWITYLFNFKIIILENRDVNILLRISRRRSSRLMHCEKVWIKTEVRVRKIEDEKNHIEFNVIMNGLLKYG